MGVEANDPVSMQRALFAARERTRQRMLPPVKVLREGRDRLELDLALPASRAEQMMRWVLQEETGARQELGQTEQVNLSGNGESSASQLGRIRTLRDRLRDVPCSRYSFFRHGFRC